jgi:hypothetical protein
MPTSGNIQLVLRALEQNPIVKASGLLGKLYVGAINQFGFQVARRMSGFGNAAIVDVGSAIGTPDELPHTFGTGASPLLQQHGCASRVMTLKQGRQQGKRVCLTTRGKELQFVTEVHGLHTTSIPEPLEKENPPQKRRLREQPSTASGRPLRLRASGLQRPPTQYRRSADRHAAPCASRGLCSGVRPSALHALKGGARIPHPPEGGRPLRAISMAPSNRSTSLPKLQRRAHHDRECSAIQSPILQPSRVTPL